MESKRRWKSGCHLIDGFRRTVRSREQTDELMKELIPQDLVRFGLIPELVGACRSLLLFRLSMSRR